MTSTPRRTMRRHCWGRLLLVCAAVVNQSPAAAVFSIDRGCAMDEREPVDDVRLLLRHRGLLFAILSYENRAVYGGFGLAMAMVLIWSAVGDGATQGGAALTVGMALAGMAIGASVVCTAAEAGPRSWPPQQAMPSHRRPRRRGAAWCGCGRARLPTSARPSTSTHIPPLSILWHSGSMPPSPSQRAGGRLGGFAAC
ncbi:hypothetical protein [Nocardia cyriacigeorgica]|uniref:hypothetical protein n=1 Tax=Nocardia cyriacigeorgica TaxID=135487 RepID=UPI0013D1D4D3|nr:hypothetical protein [Nocardia cyriacigeorgica]NEW27120.1 hypothetical protein [Nocardia cyriacigeorgica]